MIRDSIKAAQITAMKSGDKPRLAALRLILAKLKDRDIELRTAAQLPEETYISYGGTYYAIPRQSAPENKALAWELIQMLTLDRDTQLAAFKTQDAFPALLAAQDDPVIDDRAGSQIAIERHA